MMMIVVLLGMRRRSREIDGRDEMILVYIYRFSSICYLAIHV
jgi:hypothetical protein